MTNFRCPDCNHVLERNADFRMPSHCDQCGTSLKEKNLAIADDLPSGCCEKCWRESSDDPPRLVFRCMVSDEVITHWNEHKQNWYKKFRCTKCGYEKLVHDYAYQEKQEEAQKAAASLGCSTLLVISFLTLLVFTLSF